jgi:hypothetical protein
MDGVEFGGSEGRRIARQIFEAETRQLQVFDDVSAQQTGEV